MDGEVYLLIAILTMPKKFRPIRLLVVVLTIVVLGTLAFSSFHDRLQGNLKNASVGNVQHYTNH